MGKAMNLTLGGFIAVLVGVILISTLADDINASRNLFNEREELTLTAGAGQTTFTRLVDCTNASNKTNDITVNIDTLFNCSTAGVITTQPNISGQWNVSYNYGDALYVQDSTSRSLLPLVTLFFALAIMAAGIGAMYYGLKEAGIINL